MESRKSKQVPIPGKNVSSELLIKVYLWIDFKVHSVHYSIFNLINYILQYINMIVSKQINKYKMSHPQLEVSKCKYRILENECCKTVIPKLVWLYFIPQPLIFNYSCEVICSQPV